MYERRILLVMALLFQISQVQGFVCKVGQEWSRLWNCPESTSSRITRGLKSFYGTKIKLQQDNYEQLKKESTDKESNLKIIIYLLTFIVAFVIILPIVFFVFLYKKRPLKRKAREIGVNEMQHNNDRSDEINTQVSAKSSGFSACINQMIINPSYNCNSIEEPFKEENVYEELDLPDCLPSNKHSITEEPEHEKALSSMVADSADVSHTLVHLPGALDDIAYEEPCTKPLEEMGQPSRRESQDEYIYEKVTDLNVNNQVGKNELFNVSKSMDQEQYTGISTCDMLKIQLPNTTDHSTSRKTSEEIENKGSEMNELNNKLNNNFTQSEYEKLVDALQKPQYTKLNCNFNVSTSENRTDEEVVLLDKMPSPSSCDEEYETDADNSDKCLSFASYNLEDQTL